jgi:hypothetical protein
MPKAVEERLRKEAERKFPNDKKRQNAYIYGTLRKTGWKPKGQK